MLNCLIWGSGKVFTNELQGIRYLEITNQIQVCGITTNVDCFSKIAGYTYISKDDLRVNQYDVVFIMADGKIFKEIIEEAVDKGFDEDILVHHRVIHIINNNLEKYLEIKKRHVTIFANSCWGGFVYHALGLEFNSPLINMSVSENDYLKLLQSPQKYMRNELVYIGDCNTGSEPFPLARCGDITLRFDHYSSFEEAREKWEERKQRINWENVFLMFCTETMEYLTSFSKLRGRYSISFSPFRTEIRNNVQINFYHEEMKQFNSFGSLVACLPSEQFQYLDLIDLLYDGTITKLSQE